MQGYWSRPDLNERALVAREMPGGHLQTFYRTGDLITVLADGNYVFAGRKDRQVKVRGFRVELDEVEAELAGHRSVLQAAVCSVADSETGCRLEAACVVSADADIDGEDLRTYLGTRLPSYAVPTIIHGVDDIPRIATGKTDYQTLSIRFEKAAVTPAEEEKREPCLKL